MIDVLVQAGHEGGVRNSGTGTKRTTGTAGEQARTPLVADQVTETLQAAGFIVQRENAFFDQVYDCRLAVYIHFDGSGTPCASGASMGYPEGTPAGSNKPAADLWRTIYGEVWPFQWKPDNFTAGLRGYYGYPWTNTSVAEVVFEMGELTCPEQKQWLDERIDSGYLGDLIAYWASELLGGGVSEPKDKDMSDVINGVEYVDLDTVSSWADVSVREVIEQGWIIGSPVGDDPNVRVWTPKGVVTREQLAVILNRVDN